MAFGTSGSSAKIREDAIYFFVVMGFGFSSRYSNQTHVPVSAVESLRHVLPARSPTWVDHHHHGSSSLISR